jgi:hypothetical protein
MTIKFAQRNRNQSSVLRSNRCFAICFHLPTVSDVTSQNKATKDKDAVDFLLVLPKDLLFLKPVRDWIYAAQREKGAWIAVGQGADGLEPGVLIRRQMPAESRGVSLWTLIADTTVGGRLISLGELPDNPNTKLIRKSREIRR